MLTLVAILAWPALGAPRLHPRPVSRLPERQVRAAAQRRPPELAVRQLRGVSRGEIAESALFDHYLAQARPEAVAAASLEAVRGELAAWTGGHGAEPGRDRISAKNRVHLFRSGAFKRWVAAERAAGRRVFWLRDLDKTQAAGDISSHFFRWKAERGHFTAAQNRIMRRYLARIKTDDPALARRLRRAPRQSPAENARLVLDLWRHGEKGGKGIKGLDFFTKAFWPTQHGFTRQEKREQAEAFAAYFSRFIYPHVRQENLALARAGVDVVIVSAADQEIISAVAPLLGLKPSNVVGSYLIYGEDGRAKGEQHAYDVSDRKWLERPNPGKALSFHYWLNKNKRRWGWKELDPDKIVIAGADGDSASSDGGLWVYFPRKALGNFMVDTPHEPGRLEKSIKLVTKYGWDRHFVLEHEPGSPTGWSD
ncbi:MAG: hypothetical protein HY549_05995 [Elusimicrobia bacterium]|nr:hypothetical protein [Elusimicrobiota bacterium]